MVIAVETQSSLDSKIVLVFYVVFEIDPLRVASCIFHVGEPVRVPPPVSLKTIEPRTPELIRILLSRRRIGREREGGREKKEKKQGRGFRRVAYGATLPAFEVSGMKEAAGSRVYLTLVPPSEGFSLPLARFFLFLFLVFLRVLTHETSYNPSFPRFRVARLVFRTLETTTIGGGMGGGGGEVGQTSA